MDTSAFDAPPAWTWPDDPVVSPQARPQAQSHQRGSSPSSQHVPSGAPKAEDQTSDESRGKKHYLPRTCRICLETVLPTYNPPSDSLPSVLQSDAKAHPNMSMKAAYKRGDMLTLATGGETIGNAQSTQLTLTISILVLVMFLLGFVADPIINLYLDPYTTLSSASRLSTKAESLIPDDDPASWTEHFLKGLASLGLLSFIKVVLALSPWQWWNLRNSGLMSGGGRAAGTGRERLASISWIVVFVGVGTFLWTVYKGVRAWSRRTLEKAGERVIDVQGSDDDDDDDANGVDADENSNEYSDQNVHTGKMRS
ncbi:MAG: hypothetical protein M1835_005691 [Candelina submexicana]|nr:MAG: hypothetical protein M1835_005691 [Candelina submexicana]